MRRYESIDDAAREIERIERLRVEERQKAERDRLDIERAHDYRVSHLQHRVNELEAEVRRLTAKAA
jgi:ABC-type phosphate transport system auxiliary subunit